MYLPETSVLGILVLEVDLDAGILRAPVTECLAETPGTSRFGLARLVLGVTSRELEPAPPLCHLDALDADDILALGGLEKALVARPQDRNEPPLLRESILQEQDLAHGGHDVPGQGIDYVQLHRHGDGRFDSGNEAHVVVDLVRDPKPAVVVRLRSLEDEGGPTVSRHVLEVLASSRDARPERTLCRLSGSGDVLPLVDDVRVETEHVPDLVDRVVHGVVRTSEAIRCSEDSIERHVDIGDFQRSYRLLLDDDHDDPLLVGWRSVSVVIRERFRPFKNVGVPERSKRLLISTDNGGLVEF